MDELILVINTGSSSLKFGLYRQRAGDEELVLNGLAEGIGHSGGKLEVKDAAGRTLRAEGRTFASQGDALASAAKALAEFSPQGPSAVGHRVVHGGPWLTTHQAITPALLEELRAYVHFAPLHLPVALELIERTRKTYKTVPQFACFDTAFHTTMPEAARRLALPRKLYDQGVRRYGFHGLSYESIVRQLAGGLGSRAVVAHLGSGASLVALAGGCSVDTTMGLTPAGGIPMATRSGDLDPAVLLYLLRAHRMNADSLEEMLNHKAGLAALSDDGGDMRTLESAAATGDAHARFAIDAFCIAVRKTVAAYAAVLSGLDTLVFTGGIGEHSVRVRADVCRPLAFLGIMLHDAANAENASDQPRRISGDDSRVHVWVAPSEEDRQIARHCRRLLQAAPR